MGVLHRRAREDADAYIGQHALLERAVYVNNETLRQIDDARIWHSYLYLRHVYPNLGHAYLHLRVGTNDQTSTFLGGSDDPRIGDLEAGIHQLGSGTLNFPLGKSDAGTGYFGLHKRHRNLGGLEFGLVIPKHNLS